MLSGILGHRMQDFSEGSKIRAVYDTVGQCAWVAIKLCAGKATSIHICHELIFLKFNFNRHALKWYVLIATFICRSAIKWCAWNATSKYVPSANEHIILWHIYSSLISHLHFMAHLLKLNFMLEMQLQYMCQEMMDMWNATSKDEPWNDVVEMQQRRKCATAAEPLLAGKMGGAKGWLRWNWWWDHLFQNRFLWSLRGFLERLRGICRESQGVSQVLIESLGIWVVLKGVSGGFKGPQGRVKWFPDNHQTDWHKSMIILW